jgi:hypothetical protein
MAHDAAVLAQRSLADRQMGLFPGYVPEPQLTFEEVRSRDTLPAIEAAVAEFFARWPRPVEFRWLHAELAEQYCGQFSEPHLREIVSEQRKSGALSTSTRAITRKTVVAPSSSAQLA